MLDELTVDRTDAVRGQELIEVAGSAVQIMLGDAEEFEGHTRLSIYSLFPIASTLPPILGAFRSGTMVSATPRNHRPALPAPLPTCP